MMSMNQSVIDAIPKGGGINDVVTLITRPMWNRYCSILGWHENSEPTDWIDPFHTRRVGGSMTIIVEVLDDRMASISISRRS